MDQLFLLKPDFPDHHLAPAGQLYYCPSCAIVEGVLAYYPSLRQKLQITYVDFPRPRPEIVHLLGEANQGCPVLVLASSNRLAVADMAPKIHANQAFYDTTQDILHYLARTYLIGLPHP